MGVMGATSQCSTANPVEIAIFLGGEVVKTPELIIKKFGLTDYVGDDSLHGKLKMNAPLGTWHRMHNISPLRGFYHATLC